MADAVVPFTGWGRGTWSQLGWSTSSTINAGAAGWAAIAATQSPGYTSTNPEHAAGWAETAPTQSPGWLPKVA